MESCAHPNHLISVTEMFISEFIKNLQEDYKKSNPRFTTYLFKYSDQLQILKGLTILEMRRHNRRSDTYQDVSQDTESKKSGC